MQELRLVGVHQDGRQLLLAARDGTRFRVAITEELRVAARNRGSDAAALVPMTAKDIQALIRSGASTEEAAERSGWPLTKVEVFAAPVLAERAHIAGLATASRLRQADGGESERLEDRVGRRLAARGVEPDEIGWDTGRDHDGVWRVHCDFVAGGRERRATWAFEPATGHLQPADDEARWLAGDDDPNAARPQPHRLSDDRVFDVEADGGIGAADDAAAEPTAPGARSDQTDALMTAIRAHTHAGQRRGRRRRPARADTVLPDGGEAADTGLVAETDPAAEAVAAEPGADERLQGADELPFEEFDAPAADDSAAPSHGADATSPGPTDPTAATDATRGTTTATDLGATVPPRDTDDKGRITPAKDLIPPPARGIHPLDAERAASERSAPAQRAGDPAGPLAEGSNSETPVQGSDPEPVRDGAEPSVRDEVAVASGVRSDEPAALDLTSLAVPAPDAPTQPGEPATTAAPGPSDDPSPAPDAQADQTGHESAGPDKPADPEQSVEPEPPSATSGANPGKQPAAVKGTSRRKGRVGVPNWNDVMFGPAKDSPEDSAKDAQD